MSFSICESVKNCDVPLQSLCEAYNGKRVTVGVAIVDRSTGAPKLLLLQRAADEDAYPNMYELPGGNWENEDVTILHTVAREALEETGLTVERVVAEFPGFEYTAKRGAAQQLNFIVQIDEAGASQPVPTPSPEQHQAYLWVGVEDNLDHVPMSESMSCVVKDVFVAIQEM